MHDEDQLQVSQLRSAEFAEAMAARREKRTPWFGPEIPEERLNADACEP